MRYLGEVSDFGTRLMKKLWPGPVALVFDVPAKRRSEVAQQLDVAEGDIYAADGTITLRLPDHIVASDVIGRIDRPVVVTVAGSSPQGPGLIDRVGAGREGRSSSRRRADAVHQAFDDPSREARTGMSIVRAGIYDERIIERLLRTTILFVCSGNTCRSPMAEAMARTILAEKLKRQAGRAGEEGRSTIVSAGAIRDAGLARDAAGGRGGPGARRGPDPPPLPAAVGRADPPGRRHLHHEPRHAGGDHGAGPVGGRENLPRSTPRAISTTRSAATSRSIRSSPADEGFIEKRLDRSSR